jgi:DNA-binding MarR family transcriptional regulator
MKNDLIALIDKFFLEHYKSFFENLNALAAENERVSYREYTICDLIERHPGCNLSFIAERLEVSNSAITQQINSLLKKNYVSKTSIQSDKRNKGLNITDKYKTLVDRANHMIFDRLYDRLSERERESFYKILKKSLERTDEI